MFAAAVAAAAAVPAAAAVAGGGAVVADAATVGVGGGGVGELVGRGRWEGQTPASQPDPSSASGGGVRLASLRWGRVG